MKLNLLYRFSKNPQISDFTQIRPVGAELIHADGRTDMTKLWVALRNFANVPNKYGNDQFIPFYHTFQPSKAIFRDNNQYQWQTMKL